MAEEQKKIRNTKLKREDEVIVISGSQKGKRGKIMAVINDRVYVQGVNKLKRFQRPTQENPQGGILEIESSIHISNVQLYDSKKKKGVRLGYNVKDDKKVRVSRPDGKEVDK